MSYSNLHTGNTQSCGCLRREQQGKQRLTHGLSSSPEYHIWRAIKDRCDNPKMQNYQRYGGRGVRMDPTWRESFEAFYRDMGPRPSAKHSIERRDNAGHYTPENCYWATRIEQGSNKRNNRRLEFRGVTLTVSEWARVIGIPMRTLHARLKAGWSVERALSTQRQ